MKATSANFLTVIKGPKQFVIPIYQRTYSWQIAQCNKLFNDILRISRDANTPGHFIGSVVLRLRHKVIGFGMRSVLNLG